jgi:hypothetical protein
MRQPPGTVFWCSYRAPRFCLSIGLLGQTPGVGERYYQPHLSIFPVTKLCALNTDLFNLLAP